VKIKQINQSINELIPPYALNMRLAPWVYALRPKYAPYA